jgi:hypothetical protein
VITVKIVDRIGIVVGQSNMRLGFTEANSTHVRTLPLEFDINSARTAEWVHRGWKVTEGNGRVAALSPWHTMGNHTRVSNSGQRPFIRVVRIPYGQIIISCGGRG